MDFGPVKPLAARFERRMSRLDRTPNARINRTRDNLEIIQVPDASRAVRAQGE